MKIRFTVNQAMMKLGLLLICMYSFSRLSFGENISLSIWVSLISLGCLMFVASVYGRRIENIMKLTGADFLAILMCIIMVVWNNWDLKYNVYTTIVNIISIMIFFIAGSKANGWFSFFAKFTIFAGMFYAFWTIITWLSPSIFYGFVLPLIEGSSIYNLANQYESGYMMGMTSHYSTNGLYLSSGICFTFCYYFFTGTTLNGRNHKLKGMLLLGFQIFALLLSGKRGPIIYIAIAFIVTYIIYNVNKPITRYFKIVGIGFAVIVVYYIASRFVPSLLNFLNRFQETIANGDVSMRRFDLWYDAWTGFLKHPIFGNGWFWYRYHNMYGLVTYHAHNCFIQWLCELGLVGSVPFFAFVMIMYYRAVRIFRKACKKEINLGTNSMSILAISVAYQSFFLCMCFAGTAFYEMQSLCPYILCCAVVQYYWRYMRKEGNL